MKKTFIILAVIISFKCGEGNLDIGGPPALLSQSKSSGSIIAENASLTFTFDKALSSVELGGTLGSQAQVTINATAAVVSAKTTFSAGTGQTLTLTPTSSAGVEGSTTSLNYDVYIFANAVYVSDGFGNDNNPGTQAQPKQTPAAAITAAAGLFTSGTVRLAQKAGGYDVGNGSIHLVEGVSLEGGYTYNGATWSGPNATANETILTRTTGSGGGVDDPLATVICGNGITSATTISKLTFQGINQQYSASVRANSGCQATFSENKMVSGIPSTSSGRGYALYIGSGASPTIRLNQIDANSHPAAPNFLVIVGIRILGGSPTIERNTILRGVNQAGTSTSAHGIFQKDSSSATIRNNIIYGGYANLLSYAILLDNSISNIFNNSIVVGRVSGVSNLVQGIFLRNSSTPDIRNNIIVKHASTTNNTNCIEENSSGTNNPTSLQNNGLFNCDVLYKDNDSGQNFNTLCTGNFGLGGCGTLLTTPTGSNNTVSNPSFTDLDGADNNVATNDDNMLSLQGASAYKSAGLNLDTFFTNDFTGTTRPANPTAWSIGAYE